MKDRKKLRDDVSKAEKEIIDNIRSVRLLLDLVESDLNKKIPTRPSTALEYAKSVLDKFSRSTKHLHNMTVHLNQLYSRYYEAINTGDK